MSDHKDIDDVSGIETTGHSWDGIKELNNPLPRWWLWTFYACIAYAAVYTVLYPAWPLVNSATTGLLGWSSRADLRTEMSALEMANADRIAAIRTSDVAAIAADPELRPFAIAAGEAAYKVNCVQCHGSGAAGGPGYPNLNDDAWIWGGSLEEIAVTLQHGIRYAPDPDTRVADMPAFGRDGILDRDQIGDVAQYVLSLTGRDDEPEAATRGADIYAQNCVFCHGETGEGMKEVGAPALNDAIWLYGRDATAIATQVSRPRHGVMPAWGERLGDTAIKELAVYVHSLGGGE
ncbi:cytochrome-c oxidase fixP [Aurantimonas manganoxydans SI85-9A1]|uniref:Cbb3-type cytochrome c oxidase subunit n=2 Tax=Aurantimonas manganoxydans TaxID=651183 RepID=Q1YNS3_AURMS|nr:cytochrome-c oxidase, cbb3-type subunit III [Aurantimonas manganoxydans]EAS50949.1 cytochrome-c oxidase fixP [Aurantimonas manganoxydans SI85-9A1]BAT29633.1 cytochrome-c oxidase fixP [Aurantimonas manganoxydans SI85-9A1]